MALDNPSIVVVGAGGMGALFGAILQDGGLSVTLVDSNAQHVAAINEQGLAIEGFGGDRTVTIPAHTSAEAIEAADVILFQCKGHGTRAAARSVRHLTESGAVCISFQNGLGNEETIAEEVGSEHVMGGLTAMAGCMLAPGRIQDFSRVPSYIGEMAGGMSARARIIADAFTAAGLETHASDNVVRDIWKKLLGNVAMSAVSGTTNLTSAQCLAIPTLRETSIRALDEALAVATAHGIELDRQTAIDGMEFISVPGGTGDNKSSLCVDILNQRPSEVEFIYGSVIAKGRQMGIATPTLDTLASLVRGIESKYVRS
jgi:2-dehydropantoate 2-reductase